MKKLLTLLFVLTSITGFCQFPLQQTQGSGYTQINSKGAYASDSGYVFKTNWADTSRANLGFLDNIPNIVIVANDTLWKRNTAATRWEKLGAGGGGSSVTIASYGKNATRDSTILLLSDGTRYAAKDSIGITATPVTVASYSKNASRDSTILLLSDGTRYAAKDSFQIDGIECGSLLQGGIVTWDSLLVFSVSAATYCINNGGYNSESQSITLDPADPSLPRIDVIGLDTNGLVFKITGTPAADPAIPQTDPNSQLYLTSVFIAAGATTPSNPDSLPPPSNVIIWNENVGAPTEYVPSASGLTSNFDYTANPANVYAPVKSSDIGAFTVNDIITYTGTPAYSTTTYPILRFFIKNKLAVANNAQIGVQLMSGGVVRTATLNLTATHGYSKTNVANFQNVSIPIQDFVFFQLTPSIDGIRFITTGNGGGFYIDYITLNGGVVNSNPNSSLSLAPIGSNPNANGATLSNNVLNLEPANPFFGGVVTASNTPQFFKGQKSIISATDTIASYYSNGIQRSVLYKSGVQGWKVFDGANEVGNVALGTPLAQAGFIFSNEIATGRVDVRSHSDSGGLSIGSLSSPLGGKPQTQFIVLPNGHTKVTGFTGNTDVSGILPVVDNGYMFEVTGTTKITDSLTIGNVPVGSGSDSVLVKTAQGLVKKVAQSSISGSGNPNSNVGSGFRLAIPNTNNIKTLVAGTNVTLDSLTANSITINATGGSPGSTNPRYHNILITGQSNAWGASGATAHDTASNSRVLIWQHAQTTPAWTVARINQRPFRTDGYNSLDGGNARPDLNGSANSAFYLAKKIAAENPYDTVRIVMAVADGRSISFWFDGATRGQYTDSLINRAAASGITHTDVFIWDQGESDGALAEATYISRFDSIKNTLRRQTWFAPTTPIVVSGLPQISYGAGPSNVTWKDTTLQKMDYDSDVWTGYGNTVSGLTIANDSVHFTGGSYDTLGRIRYYQAWKALPYRFTEQNKPLTGSTFTSQALTDGAIITWNMTNGSIATVTLGGNRTLVITNPRINTYGQLTVTQDGTGSRTLALPAGSKVIAGGAGVVTLTTTAAAKDILTFWYDGTNYYWNFGKNYN